ncbi:hypothetical protein BFT35_05635 [Thermoanaerobacterium thermosaccharolyticum]|uniref:S-layer homology domain-containing protein n=1 Tax=Thermoanaerobacterium thermosaccharolyticum TaxID=1517 RepID=UPI000C07FDFE|nr:S-layer homology domain-containing protein [Thermoanaerobacterium thermosaccharolyticum]PHO07554.1 hypothetical protein BFT35_05635 [Thermoanaerobacterium thermosaccharolyticum]
MNVKTRFSKVLSLIISILMLMPVFSVNGYAGTDSSVGIVQFSDVNGHWAETTINDWAKKGLISGYTDGTFKPNNSVTRAEFLAFINRSFNLTQTADINFKDVKSTDWFYNDLRIAKAANIIDGYEDNTMRPNNSITREEAAAIVARLLNLRESGQDLLIKFKDSSQVSEWSKGSLNALVANGLIAGYDDNTISPKQPITRAEAVVLLSRAQNLQQKLSQIIYDKAGTYGPETGTDTINNNVEISVPDVTLQNLVINGNLIIDKSVGDGNVALKNVTVNGTVNVNGGGEHSVVFENCSIVQVVVNKEDGKVRIVASGSTKIDSVTLQSGAKLEEDNATNGGFANVTIDNTLPADSEVILSGNFDNVKLNAPNVVVSVSNGSVKNLLISDEAKNSAIDIADNAIVTTLSVNAPVSVTGNGTIETANINVNGVTLEQKPISVNISGGVTTTISGQTVTSTGNNTGSSTGSNTGSNSGSSTGSGTGSAESTPSYISFSETNITMPLQSVKTVQATVYDTNNEPISGAKVYLSSYDRNVVDVIGNGKILAVGPGATKIQGDYNGVKAEINVTVEDVAYPSIVINQPILEMNIGDTKTVQATVYDTVYGTNGQTVAANVYWSSDDTSIATVDSNGTITAVNSGLTTISATYGNLSATMEVFVMPKAFTDAVSLTGNVPYEYQVFIDRSKLPESMKNFSKVMVSSADDPSSYLNLLIKSEVANGNFMKYDDTNGFIVLNGLNGSYSKYNVIILADDNNNPLGYQVIDVTNYINQ